MIKKHRVKISKTYLAKLQESEKFLNALHEEGVDDWDGYQSAMELFMKNKRR